MKNQQSLNEAIENSINLILNDKCLDNIEDINKFSRRTV